MKKLLFLLVAVAVVASCKKTIQVPDKVQVEEITTLLEDKEVNVDMLVAYLPEFVNLYEEQVDALCLGNTDDVQKEEMKMQLPKVEAMTAKLKQIAESTDDEEIRYELNRCNARISTKLQLSKQHLGDITATDTKQATDTKKTDVTVEDVTISAKEFSPKIETTNKKTKTLYYVVVASRESLREAAIVSQNMPDGLESPVYKAFSKGKTVYRVCSGCYTNKKDAKELVTLLKDYYYMKAWIWTDETNAECVYRPTGGNGNPVRYSSESASNGGKKVYSSAYDGYVNIRRSASAKSAIIGELENGGDGAKYLGKHGNWYKVSYYGTVGYVNSSHCYIE